MQTPTRPSNGPTSNDPSIRWIVGGGAVQMALIASVLLIAKYPIAAGLLLLGVGLGVVLGYVLARRLDGRQLTLGLLRRGADGVESAMSD